MLTYKVKYRLPGQLFYKTIKNVVEDDVFAEGRMRAVNPRFSSNSHVSLADVKYAVP